MPKKIKQKIELKNIEKILEKYNLDKIEKIKELSTNCNISFLITANKGNFFLRFSPYGHMCRSKKEIEAELEIINHLHSHNFPTPTPIGTKDDCQIVSLKNHFGYARKYINAKPKNNPNLDEIERFGEILGWLHLLIEGYKTKQKRTHIWDLNESRKNFFQDKNMILKSHGKHKEEFYKKFEKEILSLEFPDNLPSGTIHEDLGKRHVLWKDKKIVGVIDFDRCYFGKLVSDLGQACRGWCFSNDLCVWRNNSFNKLINGYKKHRKLTGLEKKYLVDAIKFGILERSLSFYLRYINTNNPDDENYSMFLIDKNGPLEIIENNRDKIERYLKIV